MDTYEPTEPPRRYYIEGLAAFVEQVLDQQPEEQRLRWAHLPDLIRAHPFPFFYAAPSERIVDVVLRPRKAGSGA